MSRTLAAIIGGAAGAVALVGIIVFLIWFCLAHSRSASRTSETGSSDPSLQVGRHAGIELSMSEARRFDIEELSMATKNFDEKNLIGIGKFGEVYKGLLHDGMLVAIKKRAGSPTQEFVDEVRFMSSIQHRNLVSLLGYCQDNDLQFLIYEYIPNGSVSSHLYGPSQGSGEKLEFKHRLSIALGAAKGLAHLHSLSPRLVHKDFKTANVLVDENFIPKVADAGIRNILGRVDAAGPSSQVTTDEIFLAPEVKEFRRYSEKSDIYSFGVFLLELVSGKDAAESPSPEFNQNLVEWVSHTDFLITRRYDVYVYRTCGFILYRLYMKLQSNQDYTKLSEVMIDQRLGSRFTVEGIEAFVQLIMRCIEPSSERRPGMSYAVAELDRILEKEMSLTTVMGEGMPSVTLGSQLFRRTK